MSGQVLGAEALPSVTVVGAQEAVPAQKSMAEAIREVQDVPGGAAIVDMETIKQGRVATWVDSLGFAPGVFVQERFGSEEARISIRGSALSRTYHGFGLRVMQDGIPINYADGFFDMQTVDPAAARYVEVLRGPNATQYGSGTLGGAINFVSPTGYDSVGTIGRAEAGSFGYLRLQAISGGVMRPQNEGENIWDYNFSLNASRQDGYRNHSEQDSQKFVGNLGVKLSNNLDSRFFLSAIRSRSQLPGYLTKAQLESDPTAANDPTWPSGFQRRDVDAQRVANKTVYRQGDYQLELAAYAMHHQLWHPITYGFIEQDTYTYGGHIKFSDTSRLFGANNVLTIGYLPDVGRTDGRNRCVDSSSASCWPIDLSGFTAGALSSDYRQDATNHRFLLENKFSLSADTLLIGSIQYHHSNRKKTDSVTPASNYDINYAQWIPRLGVVHNITSTNQVFANISQNFEPPIFDVASTMLASKAQTGTSYEVGSRGKSEVLDGRGQVEYDVTVYRADLRNEFQTVCITGTPLSNCSAWGDSQTVNIPKTVHQGLELGFSGVFDRRWRARGVALYSDFRFDDHTIYANNRLPGIPPLIIRGEVAYLWEGLAQRGTNPQAYAGPTFEWVPTAAPMDNTNSVSNQPYAIFGFKAGGPLDSSWSWFFDARNIADKKYAATTNISAGFAGIPDKAYYPGVGRSAYLGLEGKW